MKYLTESFAVEANAEETDSYARLSDDEILDQMSTFLFGGSDSIATAITWCIHLLSLHTEWQDRLREEVLPIVKQDEDAQIMQLDCSPVLDHVVRESLRLAPPVHSTIRECHLTYGADVFLSQSRSCHQIR
jgi:cytochrome P450